MEKRLSKSVIIIQKYWRGFKARKTITLNIHTKLTKRFKDLEKVHKMMKGK